VCIYRLYMCVYIDIYMCVYTDIYMCEYIASTPDKV